MMLRVFFPVIIYLCTCSFSFGERSLPDIENDNIIVFWNKVGLELNRVDHTGPEVPGDQLRCTQGPPNSVLQLASAHGAMFDAYNSIVKKYKPYQILVDDAEGGDTIAAISKAANDIFSRKYPLQREYIKARFIEAMTKVSRGESRRTGLRVGKYAAEAMLRFREGDGSCIYGDYTYSPEENIGHHQDDPNSRGEQVVIGPRQGHVKPYTVKSIKQFLGRRPPEVESRAYTRAFKQVKYLGADGTTNPTTRNPQETAIGWYHSYNGSPMIGTPCVLVNEAVIEISVLKSLSTEKNVVLFAQANLAMADGGIASWRDKYRFNYWRPIIGIRRADEDNNDGTEKNEDWYPLGAARSNPYPGECNFTPPFPTYTSGHATFCAAGIKALMNVLQSNDVKFNFVSSEFNGETWDELGRVRPRLNQVFDKLSVFSSQCAASRIFNGVHWAFDGTVAANVGYKIADHVYEKVIVPESGPEPQAFTAPKAGIEIQQILKGKITPVFEVLDNTQPVDEALNDYLDRPVLPGRESCVRPLV